MKLERTPGTHGTHRIRSGLANFIFGIALGLMIPGLLFLNLACWIRPEPELPQRF